MKQFFQTITAGKGEGNCHQYAVASLLGIDPDQVPPFQKFEDWRTAYVNFMIDQGYDLLFVPIKNEIALRLFLKRNRLASADVLFAVKSFTHDCDHLIVGRLNKGEVELVFDPNPNNQMRTIDDYQIVEIDIPIERIELPEGQFNAV